MRSLFVFTLLAACGYISAQTTLTYDYQRIHFPNDNVAQGYNNGPTEAAAPLENGATMVFGRGTVINGDSNEAFVAKLDANLNVVWKRKFWGEEIGVLDVDVAADGNYLVACDEQYPGSSEHQFRMVKLDTSGSMLWSSFYANIPGYSYLLTPIEMAATPDGGALMLSGLRDSYISQTAMQLNKIDSAGNLTWHKVWSTQDGIIPESMVLDSLGQVYVAGYTHFGFEAVLSKLSPTGDVLWTRYYSTPFAILRFSQITLLDDSHLVMAGTYMTLPYGPPADVFAIALDSSGMNISAANYWESNDSIEIGIATNIFATSNGRIMLEGITYSQNTIGPYRSFMLALTPSLDTLGAHRYYNSDVIENLSFGIVENPNGITRIGWEALGTGESALAMLRLDSIGNIDCIRHDAGMTPQQLPQLSSSIVPDYNWTKIDPFGPIPYASSSSLTMNTVEICEDVIVLGTMPTPMAPDFMLYPNPSKGTFHFSEPLNGGEWRLFDNSGKLLKQASVQSRVNSLELGPLSKGIYLLHYQAKGKQWWKRIAID